MTATDAMSLPCGPEHQSLVPSATVEPVAMIAG